MEKKIKIGLIGLIIGIIVIGGLFILSNQKNVHQIPEGPHGYESYICSDGSEVTNPFHCNCEKDGDCPTEGMICNSKGKCALHDKYQEDIHYCEEDVDCGMWWGPDHCGCGNKYYKFPEETRGMRPSLVCGGDPNYKCKCVLNKCQ